MVHDSVAEIHGEDLAFDRLVYNKADTRFDCVAVFEDFISKLEDVVLEVSLERQSVDGVAFVTPGIEICLEKPGNDSLTLIGIHGLTSFR